MCRVRGHGRRPSPSCALADRPGLCQGCFCPRVCDWLCAAATRFPSLLLPASGRRVLPPSSAPDTAAQSACAHSRRVSSSFTRWAPRAVLPFCEIAYTGRPLSTIRNGVDYTLPNFCAACSQIGMPGPGLCRLAPAVVAVSLRGIPGRARAAPDVARCAFSRSRTCVLLTTSRIPQDAQKRLVRDAPAVSRRVDQNCAVGDSFWATIRSSLAALPLASHDRHRSHPRHIFIDLGHPRPIRRLRDWPFGRRLSSSPYSSFPALQLAPRHPAIDAPNARRATNVPEASESRSEEVDFSTFSLVFSTNARLRLSRLQSSPPTIATSTRRTNNTRSRFPRPLGGVSTRSTFGHCHCIFDAFVEFGLLRAGIVSAIAATTTRRMHNVDRTPPRHPGRDPTAPRIRHFLVAFLG